MTAAGSDRSRVLPRSAGVVSHRSHRESRCRDGARRVAILGAVWGIVGSGPLKDPSVLGPSRILQWVSLILLITVALWLLYLALEPIVRRRWPDSLVSWTRLLRGRVLDPLVGRDVLLGVLGGIALALSSASRAANRPEPDSRSRGAGRSRADESDAQRTRQR